MNDKQNTCPNCECWCGICECASYDWAFDLPADAAVPHCCHCGELLLPADECHCTPSSAKGLEA